MRRRRLMLAITHEEAVALLGVNAWTVHNWERGQTKPAIQFIPPRTRVSPLRADLRRAAVGSSLRTGPRDLTHLTPPMEQIRAKPKAGLMWQIIGRLRNWKPV